MHAGFGTLEELLEVITWQQLGFHTKPVVRNKDIAPEVSAWRVPVCCNVRHQRVTLLRFLFGSRASCELMARGGDKGFDLRWKSFCLHEARAGMPVLRAWC